MFVASGWSRGVLGPRRYTVFLNARSFRFAFSKLGSRVIVVKVHLQRSFLRECVVRKLSTGTSNALDKRALSSSGLPDFLLESRCVF